MKNPLLYRSAWPESSRETSERFLMETLGRTRSERRRRLALAGGFRLLRSSGIDRLDTPAHAAGPDDCEISNISCLTPVSLRVLSAITRRTAGVWEARRSATAK